jgi:hypothetical protein
MVQEIVYKGYTATPSDYSSVDGTLSASLGAINEDGSLRPITTPVVVMQLDLGESVKYIHKTSSYVHYIVVSVSQNGKIILTAINEKTNNRIPIGELDSLNDINSIGNTLVALTDEGVFYFLWADGAYKLLGNRIPDIELSFGLIGRPRLFSISDESKNKFKVTFDTIDSSNVFATFSEENQNKITEQVMAKVNKFIAQQTTDKGYFCFPFFVRYALRLYDDSLIYHSAPILMNPGTKQSVVVTCDLPNNDFSSVDADIMLMASSLDYAYIPTKNTDNTAIRNWKDIIKSIDVFVTKPLYTHDQSGKITSFDNGSNLLTRFIGKLYAKSTLATAPEEDKLVGNFGNRDFLNNYCEWKYDVIYPMYFSANRNTPVRGFNLPPVINKDSIGDDSSFFLLCSLEIDDVLNTGINNRKEIVVEEQYLQSLSNREAMSDDYLSRDQLFARHSFVYNNRLNLSGLRRKPYKGFYAQSMFAYCDGRYLYSESGTTLNITISNDTSKYKIQTYIKENGKEYVVESALVNDSWELLSFTDSTNARSWGTYMFYPNMNAYKMVISNNGTPCYVVNLKPHPLLNGAYATLGYDVVRTNNITSTPSAIDVVDSEIAQTNFPIEILNKIYTSQVNNPFYFPLLGINTVSTGEILGISAAAKALSEGQFGQFPLYAFTTEGVWALEVSSTGTYSAKQPITRDVVISPESITQIDSAVLFATDRGIMHISGSNVSCLTDAIMAEDVFDLKDLPNYDGLMRLYGVDAEDIRMTPFLDFIYNSRIVYDYAHQRIVVYNPRKSYAYVLSLKSQMWGMIHSNITDSINSYPSAMAMTKDGKLVDFAKHNDATEPVVIVTRPIKIDSPDAFKTINTMIQRGVFDHSHIKQVLYGSNDLQHWHMVWSSNDYAMRGFRGSPYKTFRIALVCSLTNKESISGCSIDYEQRLRERLR